MSNNITTSDDNVAPRVITINAKEAVSDFNYVAGHVYRESDGSVNIPNGTSAKNWAMDCWHIEKDDWNKGVRPTDLEAQGERPVPVRAEDLGDPIGWLDEMMPTISKRLAP